jgi:hypothetical protein
MVTNDHDLFGDRLIKTINRFVWNDFIEQAKINSKLAGIRPWKPKQFPHSANYYANCKTTSTPQNRWGLSGFIIGSNAMGCRQTDRQIALLTTAAKFRRIS